MTDYVRFIVEFNSDNNGVEFDWLVVDDDTGDEVGGFATREEAVKEADSLNDEHYQDLCEREAERRAERYWGGY